MTDFTKLIEGYLTDEKSSEVDLLRRQIADTNKHEKQAVEDTDDPERKKKIRETAGRHKDGLRKRLEALLQRKSRQQKRSV
jgi:hypothetical protein